MLPLPGGVITLILTGVERDPWCRRLGCDLTLPREALRTGDAVLVAAHVAANAKRWLINAIGTRGILVTTQRTAEFADLLAHRRPDVIVVDVGFDHVELFAPEWLAQHGRGSPIVLVSAFSPSAIRALPAFISVRTSGILFVDLDSPSNARRLLDAASRHGIGQQLVLAVTPSLDKLPRRMAEAVRGVFESDVCCDADALAKSAGMTRRSLDRNLFRSELCPASHLIIAAQVLDAYSRGVGGELRCLNQSPAKHPCCEKTWTRRVRSVLGFDWAKLIHGDRDLLVRQLVSAVRRPRQTTVELSRRCPLVAQRGSNALTIGAATDRTAHVRAEVGDVDLH
jgi:hypothetical protein